MINGLETVAVTQRQKVVPEGAEQKMLLFFISLCYQNGEVRVHEDGSG